MPNAPKVHKTLNYDARKAYDRNRASSEVVIFRSSWRWKLFRRNFLKKNPLCYLCLEHERVEPARQVHHIRPLHQRMDLALVEENCASLCTKHHAEVEAQERAGESTAHLFGERSC